MFLFGKMSVRSLWRDRGGGAVVLTGVFRCQGLVKTVTVRRNIYRKRPEFYCPVTVDRRTGGVPGSEGRVCVRTRARGHPGVE